jgi:hypothetical protein
VTRFARPRLHPRPASWSLRACGPAQPQYQRKYLLFIPSVFRVVVSRDLRDGLLAIGNDTRVRGSARMPQEPIERCSRWVLA